MRELQSTDTASSYPEIKDIANDFSSLKEDIGHLGTHIKNDGMKDLSEATSKNYARLKIFGRKIETQIKAQPLQSLAIALLLLLQGW